MVLLDTGDELYGINHKQQFMEKDGYFIPYVDIPFEPTVLGRIGISPTMDIETTMKSVWRLVSREHYYHLCFGNGIVPSDIPVRY